MARLLGISGRFSGEVIELDPDRDSHLLGRSSASDVVLEAENVSRKHARITYDPQQARYFLEDMGSLNGTYLNDTLVQERAPLTHRDRITICDMTFFFLTHADTSNDDIDLQEDSTPLPGVTVVDDVSTDLSRSVAFSLDASSADHLRLSVGTETKLRAILDISAKLSRTLSLGEVLPKILDSLFDIFPQAHRGFILLVNEEENEPVPRAFKSRQGHASNATVSRTIVSAALSDGKALLSNDAAADKQFQMAESILESHIRSVMCAPMISPGGARLGVIQIDTQEISAQFDQDDLELLVTVANQASIAVENSRLHGAVLERERFHQELAFAQEIQRGFLPRSRPEVAGYDFYDFYQAARTVGGDYFDYVELPDGRIAVSLGDVAGKGVPAALQMARLSAEVRFHLVSTSRPSEAVERLNEGLCSIGMKNRFVTFVLAILDPRSHEAILVNAGHMLPVLRKRGTDEVSEVTGEVAGLPLGLFEESEYRSVSLTLDPGDTILFYSDGFVDATDPAGVPFDDAEHPRIMNCFRSAAPSPRSIGEHIVGEIKQWIAAGDQDDDISLVAFGRLS